MLKIPPLKIKPSPFSCVSCLSNGLQQFQHHPYYLTLSYFSHSLCCQSLFSVLPIIWFPLFHPHLLIALFQALIILHLDYWNNHRTSLSASRSQVSRVCQVCRCHELIFLKLKSGYITSLLKIFQGPFIPYTLKHKRLSRVNEAFHLSGLLPFSGIISSTSPTTISLHKLFLLLKAYSSLLVPSQIFVTP